MKRAVFENLDVMTSSLKSQDQTQVKTSGLAQQQAEREARLAKALRENLLKRKEQMRARLQNLEESFDAASSAQVES